MMMVLVSFVHEQDITGVANRCARPQTASSFEPRDMR